MVRSVEKKSMPIDVLVLGDHPATYLAAALLREKSSLRILHACIPDHPPGDRLLLVNHELFSLHPLLEPLRRKIPCSPVYGVRFLADDGNTRSEYRSKATMAYVTTLKEARVAMGKLARDQGVELVSPKTLEIAGLDDEGVDVNLGPARVRARMLMLGGTLGAAQDQLLGLPENWGEEVLHRHTFVRLKSAKWMEPDSRPLISMSLDLKGRQVWAWMFPGDGQIQLEVEEPSEGHGAGPHHPIPPSPTGIELLRHWAAVLQKHGILKSGQEVSIAQAESIDIPQAGALAHEGVANRTLLIGPAGGFYAATGEDLYPNCWSTVFAVDVAKKALKEKHLQDALHPYRQVWRTELGEYMRGPRQNLKFLLPLVYGNLVMANRLAEAIVLGKPLVR